MNIQIIKLDKRYKLCKQYGIKTAVAFDLYDANYSKLRLKIVDLFGSEHTDNPRYRMSHGKPKWNYRIRGYDCVNLFGFYDERDITLLMVSI